MERIERVAILIILIILTWAVVKPTVYDARNMQGVVKAVNQQAQAMEQLRQQVRDVERDIDSEVVK